MNPDFSKLDYEDIKQNFISFLRQQDKFNGYNFEGSALNILLDILAYNTHYQALYNNITFNEAFLDSAQKRSSVVSIAKNLGYTPSSTKSASCMIEVERGVTETGGIDGGTLILNAFTEFKASKDEVSFSFYNLEDATFSVSEIDQETGLPVNYTTGPIKIREGILREVNYVIDGAFPTKKIILRSDNIDTETIKVSVQRSSSDTSGSLEPWSEVKNITTINGDTRAYYLEEGPDGYYRIYFGDGILGRRLNDGNLVKITYLECSGSSANGIGTNDAELNRTFRSVNTSIDTQTIKVVLPAFGGYEKETIQSIKYKAPKNFTSQERAVTVDDYSIVLQKDFPFIKSIKCWGGEENNPPFYGKVFIAIKPENREALTSAEKNTIVKSLSRNRSVVGVVPEIVDPNLLYLIVNVDAKIDIIKNKGTTQQLKSKIQKSIEDYVLENLDVFDADLISNELENMILNSDPSILSVNIVPQLQFKLQITYGSAKDYKLNFQNEIVKSESIDKPNIQSGKFTYLDYKNNAKNCRIYDDGIGNMYIGFEEGTKKYSLGKYENIDLSTNVPEYVGSVDYSTGSVTLNKFNPLDTGTTSIISFFANVVDNDVFVDSSTILTIDKNDPNSVVIDLIESAFRKPIK
jgi:hypothetical protein